MRTIKRITILAAALGFCGTLAFGQYNTLGSTTLTTAVTDSQTVWTVGSTSGWVAPTFGQNGTVLYLDFEKAEVQEVLSATSVRVKRINRALAHNATKTIYYGAANLFYSTDPAGACTLATTNVSPWINTQTGTVWTCSSSQWTATNWPPSLVAQTCGAGGATCAATSIAATLKIVQGYGTLSSNTLAITGMSPAFTSASTYTCVAQSPSSTTATVGVATAGYVSGSAVTFTGSGASDTFRYLCIGY